MIKAIIFIGGAMTGSVITTAIMCCLIIASREDEIERR